MEPQQDITAENRQFVDPLHQFMLITREKAKYGSCLEQTYRIKQEILTLVKEYERCCKRYRRKLLQVQ